MLIGWLLVALAGLAIGATSIGGVLVVPALHRWMGLSITDAMAVSSQAFAWLGLWVLWRQPHWGLPLVRREATLLCTALLGAVLGAWLSAHINAQSIARWIGTLALVSGSYGLWRAFGRPAALRPWPGTATQALLGSLVGIGSALSGTGGPVMLLPLLMLQRCDFVRSVQVALVVQLPIALAATATHAAAGRLEVAQALLVALVLLAAAQLGQKLARPIPQPALQTATAVLLLATALWMFVT